MFDVGDYVVFMHNVYDENGICVALMGETGFITDVDDVDFSYYVDLDGDEILAYESEIDFA